jgi:hypothetical protein
MLRVLQTRSFKLSKLYYFVEGTFEGVVVMNSINNLSVSFNRDRNSSSLEYSETASHRDEIFVENQVGDEESVYLLYMQNEGFQLSPKQGRLRNLIQRVKDCWIWFISFLQRTAISVIEVIQSIKLYKWIKIEASFFKGTLLGLDFSRTSIENLHQHQHVTVVCNGRSVEQAPCRSCGDLNEFIHHVTYPAHTNTIGVH